MSLTPRQERFVAEYLIDLNATQAAIRAGYDWIAAHGGFYVYFLVDPRDDAIFYVGKGKGRRVSVHAKEAVSGRARNGVKAARILAIVRDGLAPVERIFAAGLSEAAAYSLERILISELRQHLTNMVGGIVSHDEAALASWDNAIARLKSFDDWFMSATEAQLASAKAVFGGAFECYDWVKSEFYRHRALLMERIAVNAEGWGV